ncbi:hypothetical protein niasHS_013922 [Heterodera schachtii]|uniref:Uncharacterized protein n=1 Tax=Heterodera schachtii TaxID=97005 RepID=A0ABD2IP80_HETSC
MRNPIFQLFFIQIFLQFFANKTIGIPSYQWDSADPSKNVKTFAEFIDDIYTDYDQTGRAYSVEQKRIYFNLTFVKYATEIATFRPLGQTVPVPNCPCCAQLSLCPIFAVPNCPCCAQLSLCQIAAWPNCPCAKLSLLCPIVPAVPNFPCAQLSLCQIVPAVPNCPCAKLSLLGLIVPVPNCPCAQIVPRSIPFQVLDNKIGEGEAVPNLNVIREDDPVNEFLGFLHYDQKLGHRIANAYNETVFCAAKNQMPKRVVDQILQLTFSLAIRIMLCVIYDNYFTDYYDVGGWQLEQLLSAFQILSAQRGGTNENGIFPFQIIRIDAQTKEHFWDEIEADSAREPKFIVKLNPDRPKPFKLDPDRPKPFKLDPDRPKPFKLDPDRPKPFKLDPDRQKPFKLDPDRPKPFKLDPDRPKPFKLGPNRPKPFKLDPDRPKPFKLDPDRPKPFKLDPDRPKPFKLDPDRPKPFKLGPNRPKPFKLDPDRPKPFKLGPNRPKPFKLDPDRPKPFKLDPDRPKPFKLDPDRPKPFKLDPDRPKPFKLGPNRPKPFKLDPDRPKPFKLGPNRPKPFKLDPDRPKPFKLDPDRPKPFKLDPDRPKPFKLDPDRPKPFKLGPNRPKPFKLDPDRPKPFKLDPDRPKPFKLDPDRPKPFKLGPNRPKPLKLDPDRPKPFKLGPNRPKPFKLDPDRPKPFKLDPDRPKPFKLDPDRPKPFKLGPNRPKPLKLDPDLPKPFKLDPDRPKPFKLDPDLPKPFKLDPDRPKPLKLDPDRPKPFKLENFNFLLKLSEFTLSYYEVYNVLETILMRWSHTGNSSADKNGEHPAELYTFMEQYFNSKLNPKILQKKDEIQIGTSKRRFRWLFKKLKKDANTSDVQSLSKTDCAFVHFGTALLHRIDSRLIGTISAALSDFKNLISEREKECGTKAHREFDNYSMFYRDNITRDNTPSKRCVRLEMDLFREPLWNYARMLGIDANKCLAVLQFGEALRKRIQAKLDSVEMEKHQQQQNPIQNPSKLNEFKILKKIFEEISDNENYGKMQKYGEKFHMDLLVGEGIAALKELLAILDQIIGHYADGTEESCQLGKRRSIFLENFSNEKIKFSKILFETLSANISKM